LLRLLRGKDIGPRSRRSVEDQLGTPWGWPEDSALADLAARVASAPGGRVSPGSTLIVSVEAEGLWILRRGGRTPDAVEFQATAAASARLALRLVARDLPLYADPAALHRTHDWFATKFALQRYTPALDGESFGLSFALATSSALLEVPVPTDIIASARLTAGGSLEPVAGLERKIELVIEDALGVTKFLVAAAQRDEAERAAKNFADRRALTIVPVGNFRDAFRYVFSSVVDNLRATWTESNGERLIDEVFRTCLYGTPTVMPWKAIAELAANLVSREQDGRRLWKLALANAIARRHLGDSSVRLEWPSDEELASMHRSLRLRLIAQIVQSASDGGHDPLGAARRATRSLRDPLERGIEDLVLLGAIGRARAAAGQYEEAIRDLDEAVRGWREVAAEHESSHALSELLRLLGITGQAAHIGELCETHVQAFELLPQVSEVSIGFVVVAAGRALVQVGRFEAALSYLGDARPWPPLPRHLEGARERWCARALDGLGRVDDAAARRRKLAKLAELALDHDEGLRDQADLAELDAAIRGGDPTHAIVRKLEASDDGQSLLVLCPPGADRAAFLAEHWRY